MCKVIWVMGTNFCGSTMLNLMIGNHADTLSLGEISRISLGRVKGHKLFYLHQEEVKIGEYYNSISKKYGYNYMVDSSKLPWWYHQLIGCGIFEMYDIKPVLLYKGPVRYVASCVKHNKTVDKGIETFCEIIPRLLNIVDDYDGKIVLYRHLAKNPDGVIGDICRWANFPYKQNMKEFWNNKHHMNIGGNMGTKSMIGSKKNIKKHIYDDYISYYRSIFIDDSYKKILNKGDIQKIRQSEDVSNIKEIIKKRCD